MKLHFDINKSILTRKDDEIIASYSKNTIKCLFHCKDKWSDIYKYALFTDVSNKQYIVDLGFGDHVKCLVPEDALKGNYFLLSVFGDNRYTTTQETILIRPSGFTEKTEEALENGEDTTSSDSFLIDLDYNRFNNCHCRGYGRYDDEHLYF